MVKRQPMKKVGRWILILCLFAIPPGVMGQAKPRVPLVLISIDGLKPDYVLEADKYQLQIPNLRRLLSEGAHATGVRGVLPTVTYPSHTTLITGVSPARHGILANKPLDPFEMNYGGWYWYAEDIKVPTLWEAAGGAGLVTANVDWPVTVGAPIRFNIAQYWRAHLAEDVKIIRAVSTPGLLVEAERVLGPYPDGGDYTPAADQRRAAFNIYLLETRKPDFQTVYFSGLDEIQHEHGPYTVEAFQTLEKLDALVGQVRAAAEKMGGGKAVICVVSDHGHILVKKVLNLNAALCKEGLIEMDAQKKVKSWRAYAWVSGASAAILLKDPQDEDARKKVDALLRRLAADPANGIDQILGPAEISVLGGFPNAAFVAASKPGYRIGGSLAEALLLDIKPGGMHGYLPSLKDMQASFFIVGLGIPSGRNLGEIDMRDVAPTLAGLLGVSLHDAEGRNLLP
jgi:predicted AlkP superfamily pyrophosphatase or phosphodiesterase